MADRIRIRHRQEPWRMETISESVFDPRVHVLWDEHGPARRSDYDEDGREIVRDDDRPTSLEAPDEDADDDDPEGDE